jgi:hypothetical protein
MAIGVKPRGIARGQCKAAARYTQAIIRRSNSLYSRKGKVIFNNADLTTLNSAVTAIQAALARKTDVSVAAPP